MIGEPAQRYREDPIRMLRAVRLAAARGLEIETRSRKPIRELAPLLLNVPKARLFDEMMKLFLSGHAAEGVRRLRKEGLHHGVLPLLDVILEQPLGERFVMLALATTDARINAGKTVSPGFLFAALLWHEVLAAWRARAQTFLGRTVEWDDAGGATTIFAADIDSGRTRQRDLGRYNVVGGAGRGCLLRESLELESRFNLKRLDGHEIRRGAQ